MVLAKINQVTCAAGVNLTLPSAAEVSTGEDVLIRNTGANTLTVLGATGLTVSTIPAGTAQYLYVADNTTDAGVWGQVTFGAGSAQVNAAALAGFGLTAISATLNAATPTTATAGNYTVAASDRASLIEFNSGAAVMTLPVASTAGNNFLFYVKNAGTGAVSLTPQSSDTIDTQAVLILQPNESCMVVCSGSAWFTVGYGRSTLYQFNQLVLDVSASGGATITLTTTQASNKLLTFVGNPTGDVVVVVPNVVAIYYIQSNITTAHNITVKTAVGTGVIVSQSQRTVAIDDGTNVSSAVSVTSTTTFSLTDGSATAPAIFFSSQTNTGIYKFSTNGFGITVNGTSQVQVSSTGTEITGTLKSDGLFTASAGAAIAGTVGINGNIGVIGNETVTGTLNVTGTTTLAGVNNVGVLNNTGNIAASGTLGVGGTSTLAAVNASGTVSLAGALNVTGTTTLAATTISGTVTHTGTLNNNGALNVTGASVLNGALNVSGSGVLLGAGVASPATYVAPGATGNVLTSNGTTWTSQSSTAGTLQNSHQLSSSGAAIDFIPGPANLKRVTVSLRNVTNTVTGGVLTIQLIVNSAATSTGYVSACADTAGGGTFSSSTGFIISVVTAASNNNGLITLALLDPTTGLVACSGTVNVGNTNIEVSAGSATFTGSWNGVRVTSNNGGVFTGGEIGILYES